MQRFLALFLALALTLGAIAPAQAHGISSAIGPASSTAAGYVSTGTQTLAGDKTLTGSTTLGTVSITAFTLTGTLTVTRTAQASTAETIATFGLSDAAATLSVINMSATNSTYQPAVTWGTATGAAPAFTTRSAGTRLILYSAIDGTHVDNAIGVRENGVANTYTVQQANSAYSHIFYGGITPILTLRGDGLLTSTGGRVVKVRVALTTPITASASTDEVVISNLTTPGAVAVTLPTGVTGQRLTIKDGKGDAAANNITITPAAGTIDGAATLVLSTNYARAVLVYNGTEWNRID